jgi:hypothetical protein
VGRDRSLLTDGSRERGEVDRIQLQKDGRDRDGRLLILDRTGSLRPTAAPDQFGTQAGRLFCD